jgi:hypothetical protein
MPAGGFTVLGFLEGQPTAWLSQEDGWLSTVLPVTGGHLLALAVDDDGNVYGRFPLPDGSDELLRIEPDGSVHSLLQTDFSIGALLANEEGLLVSVDGLGNLVSTNPGVRCAMATGGHRAGTGAVRVRHRGRAQRG